MLVAETLVQKLKTACARQLVPGTDGVMLVQASRDGDLEVVLRLLYTNPFIHTQELRDAMWEAVRCRRLEILRSLLEFRVDPASPPSPALGKPPAPLRNAPWTPLLALAVNGSTERAEIVAELVARGCGECCPASRGDAPPAPHLSAATSLQCQRGGGSRRSKGSTHDVGVQCRRSEGIVGTEHCNPSNSQRGLDLLRGLLDNHSSGDLESQLVGLESQKLAAFETELESLLQMVRGHRQRRLEQQLQSVERRHAAECRGRQSLEEEQACIVCSELAKTVLFLPCRHLCTCENCAAQLSLCPICRAVISEKVRCIRP